MPYVCLPLRPLRVNSLNAIESPEQQDYDLSPQRFGNYVGLIVAIHQTSLS